MEDSTFVESFFHSKDFLIWFTDVQTPFLNFFAQIFTFMGNEEFYMLILPLVFWCFSKKVGFRLLYVFILSVYVNSFIKINMAVARPVGVEGVNSLFIGSAEHAGSHYPYDSFPSGHAQGSTTLWGYLAYALKRPYFWGLAIFFIFFISLSRLYAGLHWPLDIIGGILTAIIILIIGIRGEQVISKLSNRMKWLLAITFPFVLLLIFQEPEGAKYAGFLLGAGIAYLLESKYVQLNLNTAVWKKAIAYLIGIAIMFALQVGVKAILPENLIADFGRYMLLGLWGIVVAPWLFVKLKLYPSLIQRSSMEDPKPPLSV